MNFMFHLWVVCGIHLNAAVILDFAPNVKRGKEKENLQTNLYFLRAKCSKAKAGEADLKEHRPVKKFP